MYLVDDAVDFGFGGPHPILNICSGPNILFIFLEQLNIIGDIGFIQNQISKRPASTTWRWTQIQLLVQCIHFDAIADNVKSEMFETGNDSKINYDIQQRKSCPRNNWHWRTPHIRLIKI